MAENRDRLGLGGLTYMQLSTAYIPTIAGRSIGYAFVKKNHCYPWSQYPRQIQIFRVRNGCRWARRRIAMVGTPEPWCTSGHGIIVGKGTSIRSPTFLTTVLEEVLPLTIPLVYFFLLPQPWSTYNQEEEVDGTELLAASSTGYTSLPTDEDEGQATGHRQSRVVALSASDKWQLVKPMISKYMLPLCEFSFVPLRVDSLILEPRQVCVYLVGRHLGIISPACSPLCFIV